MKEQSGLLLGNNSMCLKNKALGWGRCCSDVSAAVPGIALLSWLWALRLGKGGVLCCAHLTPLQLSAPDSSSLPILSCCAVMLCADSREPRATGGGDLWYRHLPLQWCTLSKWMYHCCALELQQSLWVYWALQERFGSNVQNVLQPLPCRLCEQQTLLTSAQCEHPPQPLPWTQIAFSTVPWCCASMRCQTQSERQEKNKWGEMGKQETWREHLLSSVVFQL